jgi:hypothetical protein
MTKIERINLDDYYDEYVDISDINEMSEKTGKNKYVIKRDIDKEILKLKNKNINEYFIKIQTASSSHRLCDSYLILNKGFNILKEKYKYGLMQMRVGQIYTTNQNCKAEIIEILKHPYVKIEFKDKYKYQTRVDKRSLKKGALKNPYFKVHFNVGFLGEVDKTHINYKLCYDKWVDMLKRCYSEYYHNKFPTYKNVTVCNEWHNLANFQKWFNETYIKGMHLDKDLLQQGVEHKIYSPNTCIWLPLKINSFIIHRNSNNKSGVIGVTKESENSWRASCTDFELGKSLYLGTYKNIDMAKKVYLDFKKIQVEKAKKYMYKLGYWDSSVVDLVGCDKFE